MTDVVAITVGVPGPPGSQGDIGLTGPAGPTGSAGSSGAAGATGSAGAQGAVGPSGSAGLSAYQLWLNAGNTGDVNAYLLSLKGATGGTGPQGGVGATGAAGVVAIGAPVVGATGNKLLVTDAQGHGQEGAVTAVVVSGAAAGATAVQPGNDIDAEGNVATVGGKTAVTTDKANIANGFAATDGNGYISGSVLPPLAITDTHVVGSQAGMLAIAGAHEGSVAVRTDLEGQAFICTGGDPTQVANWVATGLSASQFEAAGTASGLVTSEAQSRSAADALLAPLASPTFTGAPKAVTQAPMDSSTKLGTTAYADAAVQVETTARTNADAAKAPLASPALTGAPSAPTQAAGDSSTKVSTTAYADRAATTAGSTAAAASDPAGTASTGITTHLAAVNPHGDRPTPATVIHSAADSPLTLIAGQIAQLDVTQGPIALKWPQAPANETFAAWRVARSTIATTLNAALVAGNFVQALTVLGIPTAITVAGTVKITDPSGQYSQTFAMTNTEAVGGTFIGVLYEVPNYSYPVGSSVVFTPNVMTVTEATQGTDLFEIQGGSGAATPQVAQGITKHRIYQPASVNGGAAGLWIAYAGETPGTLLPMSSSLLTGMISKSQNKSGVLGFNAKGRYILADPMFIDPRVDFGMKADWNSAEVSFTAGSNVYHFGSQITTSTADIGKQILVKAAGPAAIGGQTGISQQAIWGWVGPGTGSAGACVFADLTYTTPVNASVSGTAPGCFGSDDTQALNLAFMYASAINNQRIVKLPAAWFRYSQLVLPNGIRVESAGHGAAFGVFSGPLAGSQAFTAVNSISTMGQQLEGCTCDAVVYTAIQGESNSYTPFTATTQTGGSANVLTTVSSFNFVAVGTFLAGAGIQTGSQVVSVNTGAGTITMSLPATAAAVGVSVTPTQTVAFIGPSNFELGDVEGPYVPGAVGSPTGTQNGISAFSLNPSWSGGVGPSMVPYNPRSLWTSSTAYATNDYVIVGTGAYRCIAPVASGGSNPNADATHWAQMTYTYAKPQDGFRLHDNQVIGFPGNAFNFPAGVVPMLGCDNNRAYYNGGFGFSCTGTTVDNLQMVHIDRFSCDCNALGGVGITGMYGADMSAAQAGLIEFTAFKSEANSFSMHNMNANGHEWIPVNDVGNLYAIVLNNVEGNVILHGDHGMVTTNAVSQGAFVQVTGTVVPTITWETAIELPTTNSQTEGCLMIMDSVNGNNVAGSFCKGFWGSSVATQSTLIPAPQIVTTTSILTAPYGFKHALIELVGPGGPSSGGGAAATGGVSVGSAGSGSGQYTKDLVVVSGPLTFTMGGQGAAGAGGVANTAGAAGTSGSIGTPTTCVGTGVSLSAGAGGVGSPGSFGSTQVNGGVYGAGGTISSSGIPGCGGSAQSTGGNSPGQRLGLAGRGGGGGGPASTTLGGSAGQNGGQGGHTGTVNGGNAILPTAAGQGADGAGGGAPTGNGGNGSLGGPPMAIVTWMP